MSKMPLKSFICWLQNLNLVYICKKISTHVIQNSKATKVHSEKNFLSYVLTLCHQPFCYQRPQCCQFLCNLSVIVHV